MGREDSGPAFERRQELMRRYISGEDTDPYAIFQSMFSGTRGQPAHPLALLLANQARMEGVANRYGEGQRLEQDRTFQNLFGNLQQDALRRGTGSTTRYDKDRVRQTSEFTLARAGLEDMITRLRLGVMSGASDLGGTMLLDRRARQGEEAGRESAYIQAGATILGGLIGGPAGAAVGSGVAGAATGSGSAYGVGGFGTLFGGAKNRSTANRSPARYTGSLFGPVGPRGSFS